MRMPTAIAKTHTSERATDEFMSLSSAGNRKRAAQPVRMENRDRSAHPASRNEEEEGDSPGRQSSRFRAASTTAETREAAFGRPADQKDEKRMNIAAPEPRVCGGGSRDASC